MFKAGAVFRRELMRMWRDRDLRNVLLLGPLIALIIFYATYSVQAINEIPAAVVDLDRSSESGEIIRNIDRTEELDITAFPESSAAMEELLYKGEAVVGIVIPEDFGKNVGLGQRSRLFIAVDGSNIIYANNASSAILTVSRTMGAEIGVKKLLAKGVNYSEAQHALFSISAKDEPWFNPALNYAFFLVVALGINIWQQCCTIAASSGIAGERDVASWYQLKASGTSLITYFSWKAAARVIVFSVLAFLLYLLGFGLLQQTPVCGLPVLMLFTLCFAFAIDALGSLFSSVANNALDATRFGMVIALSSFVLCGYTWPLEAMPDWLQKIAWVLPQTWFFQGFNLLVFKTPDWQIISRYFAALLAIAAVCYSVSALTIVSRDQGWVP